MCGIAGIWQLDGRRVEPATIERFAASLAHRGPDGAGIVLADDGRLALAHRRLAILDPSTASAQPMRSASGRVDITYNGEVYDFVELRRALEQDGVRLRSAGDTEVVLEALERWGTDALPRFNGMWAFALWDHEQRRLLLSRDRFGVKPLYVAVTRERIAFASELKAFRRLDGFVAELDEDTFAARLRGEKVDGVLLRGVEMLPPGHCLEATPHGVRRWRWWRTLDHLRRVPSSLEEQAEELRALVVDACRLRMRSDVPLATSLSGGLDSSSVLCALAAGGDAATTRRAPRWRSAFIADFPGTPQDERAHALRVATHAGVEPVVHTLRGETLRAEIDAYLDQFEEVGGLHGIAAWTLYREMRRAGVVVSLDGHGGDEVFAGYALHVELALLRAGGLLAAPRRTLDLLRTWHNMQGGRRALLPRELLLAALTLPGVRVAAPHVGPLHVRTAGLLADAARHDPRSVGAEDARRAGRGAADDAADEDAIDALGPLSGPLYRSFHERSLPRVLRCFDVHSMAHGVEVRMPLLDWRVVTFAFSLPDASKVSGGYGKRVLREAMRGLMPETIRLRRDKLGYNAPLAGWLGDGLAAWIWDEVNDPAFVRGHPWDGVALRERVRAQRARGGVWSAADAHDVLLAVSASRFRTHWLAGGTDPA